jgi:hypothetical protein
MPAAATIRVKRIHVALLIAMVIAMVIANIRPA